MLRIDFYHLQKNTLDEALPKLLAKAYETGEFIKLKVGGELRVDYLNTLLWTFDEEAFLPHGTKKDGFSEMQPIFISADDKLPNEAALLFLVDGANVDFENAGNFKRIFYIFDGNNENELQKARKVWKDFSLNEAEKHYWQQNNLGKWEEKKL
ncbi:MAG: DNA polymerase III subunit chi [Alphaproteobacteria bacterium]|nr:DNA polymerase III subunit chi [Alphaproteobacteria bacterium]